MFYIKKWNNFNKRTIKQVNNGYKILEEVHNTNLFYRECCVVFCDCLAGLVWRAFDLIAEGR